MNPRRLERRQTRFQQQAKLQQRIAQCEEHKQTIRESVASIRERASREGWSQARLNRSLKAYLGDKSYDEWMLLYDELIAEARAELEALEEELVSADKRENKRLLIAAAGISFLFLIILSFLLPTPINVLTGHVLGISAVPLHADQLQQALTHADKRGVTRIVVSKGLFSDHLTTTSLPRAGPSQNPEPYGLNGTEGLELLITPEAKHAAYKTPFEIVRERNSPIGYEAWMRLENTKPIDEAFFLLTDDAAVTLSDEQDNPLPYTLLGTSEDVRQDWSGEGVLGTIRETLANAGSETRLSRIFPRQLIPGRGEHVRIYSYRHPRGTWVNIHLHAPKSGKLLFLDPAGSWWNESWNYRRPLLVTEQSGANLTNYSVKITLNASNFDFSKAQSDGADLRVFWNTTNASGDPVEQNLSLWIESWNATAETATLWTKLPVLNASANETLLLYYGNPSAASASDPDSVFTLFINFTELDVYSYGGQDQTPTQYEILDDTQLHVWGNVWKYTLRNITLAGDGSQVLEYWYNNYGPQGEIHAAGFDDDNSLSSSWTYKIYGTQSWGITGDATYTGPNGWELISETLDEYSGTFDRVFFVSDDDANSATNATFKDVRVRTYTDPEPAVTVLAEQRAELLNATLEVPANGTRFYRGEAFTMNGTVNCTRGDCGNTSAWSQFSSTLSPTTTWTETTSADFVSANTTTNVSILSVGAIALDTVQDGWFDTDWRYRYTLNLSNPGAALTDYAVNLTLDTASLISAGKLQGDCADLRFANESKDSIPYWIEDGCNTTSTTVWIKPAYLPATTNTTIYVYYGNPSAASASNPDGVFPLFLNFTRDGVNSYANQDLTPSQYEILNDTSLHMWGNVWKYTLRNITLAGDGSQVLEYWYNNYGPQGEIHAAGFDDDNSLSSSWTYKIYGTQSWGITGDATYTGPNGWELITETLDEYSGTFDRLFFVGDDDANSATNATFKNVRVRPYTATPPVQAASGAEEERTYLINAEYISNVLDTGGDSNTYKLIWWSATVPDNTTLSVATRSSADNTTWSPWLLEVNDTTIDAPSRRYLQYKIGLSSTNTSVTPRLDEINLQYQYTTTGYERMTSTTGLIASNPDACGNLTSGESCNSSWSVTPQELGVFQLRLFTNTTKDSSITAWSNNNTIEVYARTHLLSASVTPDPQARGQNVTLSVQLVDDQSTPLTGRRINLTDETDGVWLGNATTGTDGTASLTVTIPSNATLGSHTLSFRYAGNDTQFLEAAATTTSLLVSSLPNITGQHATPQSIGIADPVTIMTNVTDDVGVDTVWIALSYPDNTERNLTLLHASGDAYTLNFNDTWQAGTYTFKVWANNTDGILADPSGNFTVNVTGAMYADAEKDEYKNYETVHLADRRREDWWNSSWLYRSLVTVEGVDDPLREYQVPLTLDTASLISAGKLQGNCSDLRFVSEANLYDLPVTVTNDLGTAMTNQAVKLTITDATVLAHLADDGADLRVFQQAVSDPYAQQSDTPFWFMEKTESQAVIWVRLTLNTSESVTLHLYYGKSDAESESNYTSVFTTVVGVANTTSANGSFSSTSLPNLFNETPVIIGSLTTVNDAAEAALRLANVTAANFSAKAEESATLDGVHADENIDYLALKSGRWYIGGHEVEVATTSFSNPGGNDYNTISFTTSFSSTPVVVAQVQTFNESDPVHIRMDNPSAAGIDMKLEETQSTDTAHTTERTGYLALPAGLYETGNGHLQTGTLTTTHSATTIPYSSTFSDPVVLSKIMTENGGDNSHERVDADASSATTRVEEEDAYDGAHTTETLSWLAATPGELYGAPVQASPSISVGSEQTAGTTTKELDYYLEDGCNSSNTSLLIQVPFIPAGENVTVYLYYGNPSATSASNLTATYTYDSPQTIGYVVNSNLATLDVYSLVDGNKVIIGSSSANLDARDSLSASVTMGTAVKVTRQVQADSGDDVTDAITPLTWAGTEFLYAFHRDTDRFDIVSPWGVANVTIYDKNVSVWNGQVTSTGTIVSVDITNGDITRIVSDIPILVQHWTTSSGDAAPLYPATGEPLYGIPSTWLTIAAGPDGATVTGNSSGATQTSWSISANSSYENNGYGRDFNEQAYRLDPNGSLIGALQEADSDGREITMFLPERQLGTLFGSVRGADTIAVAAPTLGTNCTVYNSTGGLVGSGTSSGTSLVSRILFGAGNDNLYVSGGWIMSCDAPVWAIYDEESKDDETHLLGIKDLRQYHYPEPSATLENDTEENAYTGLHNTGGENITGYLYLSVETNASGSWSIVGTPVYQDINPRTVAPGTVLNISYWWEYGGAWQTSTHDPGTYRVYAAFLDNESKVLVDTEGNRLEDTGLFTIVKAYLQLNNLTHENREEAQLDEYEAGDLLDWVNITVQAVNNTAINADINLTLLNDSDDYAGWGPNSIQSCGDISEGATCTRQWNNASAGYPVPLDTPSGTYTFHWRVVMDADNGPATEENSFTIAVHNTPSTFSSSLSPTRIFTGGEPAAYNFTFTNLWSVNLSDVTARLNLPAGKGLNATCTAGGSPTGDGACTLTQLGNGSTATFSFNISANSSATQGDYWVNITLNYTNPRENRSWTEVEPRLLEVRQEGIIAITVTSQPVNVTRGATTEELITAFVNNTAASTSYNVTVNYTLPSSWTNTSPLNAFYDNLSAGETRWHNLSFTVGAAAALGNQQVLIKSGSSGGQNDFKYLDLTVWATTSLVDAWVNDTNASRGEYVRFNATLLRDDGAPVSSATITFIDVTDNVTIGTAVTSSSGLATRTYLLPADASIGLHTINISYDGRSSDYTLASSNTTVFDVGEKPVVNAAWATPSPQGVGSNVTISANVTDDDAVDTVLVSIFSPSGSTLRDREPMTLAAGLYEYWFNETWQNGTYTFTIWANDTTGSVVERTGTFTITNDAFLYLNVSAVLYGQNADVELQGNSAGWWWRPAWRYRQDLTITNLEAENFTDAQVNFTLNTASLISAGKLQSDCADLRFVTSDGVFVTPEISDCNDAATRIRLLLDLAASENTTLYVYYGNPNATLLNESMDARFAHGRHYVVSDALATSNLVLAAFEDNTSVCIDTACHVLNQSDLLTVAAADLSATTVINSSKPVATAYSYAGAGSHTVPLAFALTNVTFPAPRGTQSLDFVAPFADANVTLYDENDNVYASVTVTKGGHGEINYNAADASALRLTANTSIVVHYEDESGNNDFLPLPPPATELYGVPQGGTYSYVACADVNTNVTIYESDGTTSYHLCNRTQPVQLPAGSTGGKGPSLHIVANGSIVAFAVADGDGTEAAPFLPSRFLDDEYVVPQDTEYVTIVPVQPSTTCKLYSASGALLQSDTSTSYTPPRPQAVIRWTSVSAGARVVCDENVWAYFESSAQNAETILLGASTWRNVGDYSITSGNEQSPGSLLSNPGATPLRGSLRLRVQRNITTGWTTVATLLDDTATGTVRTINATSWLDLAALWNASPWNTGNEPAGLYRAYAELVAPDGTLLASAASTAPGGELWNASAFTITQAPLRLNLTSITVYDVTDTLNTHTYTGNLTANATNATFTFISGRAYRVEFHVENLENSTTWNLTQDLISHAGLNASWLIDAAADVWYRNASDTTDRLGGAWSSGNVTWNTSTNGGLAANGTSVMLSYVLNLSGAAAETLPVTFLIDDPLVQLTDHSAFRVVLPDQQPPRLYNDSGVLVYNLTSARVIRGENTTIFARWDEAIANATVTYNSTSPLTNTYAVTLSSPNLQNWTNSTLVTTPLWLLGGHVAKLAAADEQENWNDTLNYLSFTVWGLARVTDASLSAARINVSETTTITCRVQDVTADPDADLNGYTVTFSNGTGVLGTNTTNSTGWASWTYNDSTPGTETLSCTIAEDAARYYTTDSQNSSSFTLTTLEQVAPWPTNTSANVTVAHKGDAVQLRTLWHDNFQLDTAVLRVNASGAWSNVSSLAIAGSEAWANFSYTIPDNFAPGTLGWHQYGNDTSGNMNETPIQSLAVWGWASVESINLDPAFIYTTNTTTITCRVVDAQNSTGLENYTVMFSNSTGVLGTNTTNASGDATYRYTDYSSGIETITCQIGDDAAKWYNASSEDNKSASLTTGDGGDITPPRVINNNYGLNDTEVRKGESLLVYAEWNELINRSDALYNSTSATIERHAVPPPFTNNWTNYTLTTNASWTVGTHVVKLEATDLSNNTNTTAAYLSFNVTATSRIDWVAPTTSQQPSSATTLACRVTEEENGQGINGYLVYFYNDTGGLIGTATTNASGDATTTYDTSSYDGTYSFSCRIFSDPNLFYYIGENYQASQSLLFDGVPPSVALDEPLDGAVITSTIVPLNFTATDSHDAVLDCNVTADGSVIATTTAANNTKTTVTHGFAYGLHDWNVTCWDDLGNTNTSATWTFNVTSLDTTPPNITLLSPDDDAYLNSSTVTFSYNATDDSSVENCSLLLDGSSNQTDTGVTAGGDSFTVTELAEGSHTWAIRCVDPSSNERTSETRTFTVDTTPPSVPTLLSPADGTVTTNTTPLFVWSEVTETNFWNYTLEVSPSSSFVDALTTRYVTFTKNDTSQRSLALNPDTTYYWRVTASDQAGNTAQSATFTYLTDFSPPVVLLLDPPDGDNDPDGNVTLVFQANDNALSNCTLYTNTTGVWRANQTLTNVTPWTHASFNLSDLLTGQNFTFLWNVECTDSLNHTAFAPANRSVRIGSFNETQGNQTIPVNASVNNTVPRTLSVSAPATIDLVANGYQTVQCNATVTDDNGAADILGAIGRLYRSTVSANSPDDENNHYTNASCGSCTALNATASSCSCNFSLAFNALPGTWYCDVRGVDLGGNGTSSVTATATVNQLQAVDVRPTLLDYGDVQGGIPSPEQNISVINLGNVPLDVKLWGFATAPGDNLSMSCLNGANITISAERFSTTSGAAYETMTPLTSSLASAPLATLAVPVKSGSSNSTLPLYWRLQSGSGALGECNGTIVLHAEIG